MAKTFETIYQPGGASSGRTVQVNVFKADKTLDTTQSGVASEVGTTGRYHFSFDANEPGWFVEVSDDQGGKACQHFGRPEWDSHGIFDLVGSVQAAVAAINSAVTALTTTLGSVDGKVDGLGTQLTGVIATLATISGKIDAISQPPMIG